jgi:regulator of sigma E protease
VDLQTLLPQFGSGAVTILAFIVALSVIVAIHEYGHYIIGRWSGIKAEVFSIGFGPVLFSRMDRHGTRWQVAALPFGGFVKFLGDADAASGKDSAAMAATPPERLRQTMHGAPLWARTATVAAGPVFNFILSILIFTAVMMAGGKTADPLTVGALKPLPV